MVIEYRDEMILRKVKTEAFGHLMYKVLGKPKNISKGNWQHIPCEDLLTMLKAEVVELEQALKIKQGRDEIADECADVANFALMICDNVDGLYIKLD